VKALLRGLFVAVVVALVVIGLINFDLMVDLWVKVLIAVLFMRIITTIGSLLFFDK